MKIIEKEFEVEKKLVNPYEGALLYYISSVELYTSDVSTVNWKECSEARFFSNDGELRFFKNGEEWIVSEILDEEGDTYFDIRYELDNRFKSVGRSVVIREYYEPDEDGQMVIVAKRIACVE